MSLVVCLSVCFVSVMFSVHLLGMFLILVSCFSFVLYFALLAFNNTLFLVLVTDFLACPVSLVLYFLHFVLPLLVPVFVCVRVLIQFIM